MSRQQGSRPKSWLAAAYGWALVSGVAAFTVPASRTSTIPQIHQTLFEYSHSATVLGGSLIGSVLLIATIEFSWRFRKNRQARGAVTTVSASIVMAFSIFGFIFGVLSIGVVALFALLSATPFEKSATSTSDQLFPLSGDPSPIRLQNCHVGPANCTVVSKT
jgi:hypothetical protein